MHGAHYAPVSSPARWLEKYLHDFLPDKKIRVVNFARMGRGTEFAWRTMKQTLPYQPDLILVYLGHNIFLNRNRIADVSRERKRLRYKVRHFQKQSFFFSAVYREFIRMRILLKKDKPEDQMEFPVIETAPLSIGPENITPRNSQVYRENIAFFKEYMLAMSELAQENHIPIIFMKPVSNLKDFAPYDSLHLKNMPPAEKLTWERNYQAGKRNQGMGNFAAAESYYRRAFQIDGTYADLDFRLGHVYFKKGDYAQAKVLLEMARDNDAIIFRATQDALNVLDELKQTENIELLETEKVLASEVAGGILGEPIIEDNVHFSLKGQALAGRFMAEELAKRNLIAPADQWKFENERPYEQMAKELGIDQELQFSADLKMVHYFGSRFENRVRFAKKALRIHPNDPKALRHLAWTYWLMGERPKALETYFHLRAVAPNVFEEIFGNLKKFGESTDDFQTANLLDFLGNTEKSGFLGRPK